MDVKAVADGVLGAFSGLQSVGGREVLLFLGLLAFVLWAMRRNGPVSRGLAMLQDAALVNWRLTLLGTTGIVLSLAAGYRTWDGMHNFTGDYVLSAMMTFGVQGVMLIAAWLIGESFATGMNQRAVGADGRPIRSSADAVIGMLFGLLLLGGVLVWLLKSSGAISLSDTGIPEIVSADRASNVLLLSALAALVIGLILINRNSDLVFNYVQSARIIIKNAVLWVMFLACMGVSVFFSFDSFFTAIFPQDERVRAAELRAQNQVAGIVADIGNTIETRRLTESRALFTNDGWKKYEDNLVRLANAADGSGAEIERYFDEQIEKRNRAKKEQQERITTSESTQAGLASRKTSLVEELARMKGERGTLAGDYTEKKTELEARARAVDAKRVEAMAEEKGAEGTLKVGRGPVYRQRQDELSQLQAAYKIQEDRVKDAEKRLATTDQRISQIERELAQIDGELAKLKGEAATAQQRIQGLDQSAPTDAGARIDPSRMRPAFERARTEFRQAPTAEGLTEVQRLCSQIQTAMSASPVTKPKVANVDCDPKQASEASAVMFDLNRGWQVFGAECQGGDKLNRNKTADALFSFARKCLADSGLPSADTDALRTKINTIELSRDDKAHRFVVTWNAFSDGNRLAYLALAIAIAIDSLVFLSGLFGANAVRSPLSDVPSVKARSGRQLEDIIDTALLPHTYEAARHVLASMQAMTPREGYMARVTVWDDDPHAADLRRVLNAGATIGAVRHVGDSDNVYEIRSELFEYLSSVTRRAFEANEHHVTMAELERIVGVALLPDVGQNAQVVLDHMHPLDDPRYSDFTSEIRLQEVEDTAERAKTRNVLNAGSALRVVRPGVDDKGELIRDLYFLHSEFYKTIARIRARTLMQDDGRPRLTNGGERKGGALKDAAPALPPPGSESTVRPRLAGPKLSEQGRGDGGLLHQAANSNQKGAGREPAPYFTGMPLPAASLDEKTREKLRGDYWARLLRAINLDLETAAERLNDPLRGRQAFEAWDALVAHAESNKALRHLVATYREDQESLISEEYSELRREIGGDERRLELLHDVEKEVQSHLPALMMFPENGFIRRIIARIEAAAAPDAGLRPGEQPLKDRLKALQHDFARSQPAAE
jgi:hypothetical protein